MMAVKITALYTAILAIFFICISFKVSMTRGKYKILIGDGDNLDMYRIMRTHSNFIEYTPIFLILLLMLESMNLEKLGLNTLGTLFLLGRVFHYLGFSKYTISKKGKVEPQNGLKYIMLGMFLNHSCILIPAFVILYKTFA